MAMNQYFPSIATTAASLRGLLIAVLAGGLIALSTVPAAHADSATAADKTDGTAANNSAALISREYLIKAAILYNFAKFASWPDAAFDQPDTPLRVCVLGDDPFGAALESLNGKQVRNRTLATARITDAHDAPSCHVVFVSTSERTHLPEILDTLSRHPILTVADIDRFTTLGGIIALKKVDNRSRIEVNVAAASHAGVKLSSKLLRLADTADTARLPVDTDRSNESDSQL